MNKEFFDGLQRPLDPPGKAKGLPGHAYTDPDFFTYEREHLFAPSWAALAFEHDVPTKGSAIPIDFMGLPLLMLRDQSDKIRVYENTCRHRGMRLLDKPTKLRGVIRCPYHAWCYGLDGKLRRTPHVGGAGYHEHEGVDTNELGLLEIPSHVYMGVVLINLNQKAPEFPDMHKDLLERWQDFPDQVYYGGADSSFSLTLESNWKLPVENYCESYHLPFVHPGLNSYSKLEDHYDIIEPGQFSGQGTRVYRPMIDESGNRFCDFPNLPEKWNTAGEYISLFPNLLLGVHRDHVFAIILVPEAANRTVERIALSYASPAMVEPEWDMLRRSNAKLWRSVFEEDIGPVEGMQQGRYAKHFDGGHFSPAMDMATLCFHRWAAEKLIADGGGQAASAKVLETA